MKQGAPDEEESGIVYTIPEVARLLKISEQLVRRLIDRHELKARRIGRNIRVSKVDFETYLESTQQ